ncbi:hypothetical protein A0U92_04980 [Acetobacter aceti]|uniref:Uncharacterized protein n=1 Tax=Acetobacter aceti TaxID=435 RepID=A0A1U9KEM2_ACEAC|nr:hypothetical protein A0U92_04980 [Acetobacter aceti]
MAKRVGIKPDIYAQFLSGTHLLDLNNNIKIFEKNPGLDSIYGSTQNADNFNVRYNSYKTHQKIESYIKPLVNIHKD